MLRGSCWSLQKACGPLAFLPNGLCAQDSQVPLPSQGVKILFLSGSVAVWRLEWAEVAAAPFFPARCVLESCSAGTGLSPGHTVPGGSWKGCCREARRAAVSSARKRCPVPILPMASLVFRSRTAHVVFVFPLCPSASLSMQSQCLFLLSPIGKWIWEQQTRFTETNKQLIG